MIVENMDKLKVDNKVVSDCLFERFGRGVHLIQDKDYGSYELMVIVNKNVDALFVDEDNITYYHKSEDNNVIHEGFDEYYVYVKKLIVDELIVRLKE